MSFVAVAVGGAALLSGIYAANKQSSANKNAVNAQTQAGQQAIDEQQREYDQTRADQMPFLQAGYGALDKENHFLTGDWSGFENSPDYQFSLNQGINALDKSAAARGSLYSGGHSADLTNFAEGTADQFANNYYNKLEAMAGQGQESANTLGSLGQNTANNISNLDVGIGNARASSYLNEGNIQSQEAGLLGNAFNQWLGYYQNKPKMPTPNPTPTPRPTPRPTTGLFGTGDYNIAPLNTSTEGEGAYDVFGLGKG